MSRPSLLSSSTATSQLSSSIRRLPLRSLRYSARRPRKAYRCTRHATGRVPWPATVLTSQAAAPRAPLGRHCAHRAPLTAHHLLQQSASAPATPKRKPWDQIREAVSPGGALSGDKIKSGWDRALEGRRAGASKPLATTRTFFEQARAHAAVRSHASFLHAAGCPITSPYLLHSCYTPPSLASIPTVHARARCNTQAVEKTSGVISAQQKSLTHLLQPETAGADQGVAAPSPRRESLNRALSTFGDQSKQVFEQTKQVRTRGYRDACGRLNDVLT